MKQYRVLLSDNAKADLQEIAEYIMEESCDFHIAEAYINRLREQTLKQLSVAPQRGQSRDDLAEGLRILPLSKKTVVAFDINEEQNFVAVLNYYHGGRDYGALITGS